MKDVQRTRRMVVGVVFLVSLAVTLLTNGDMWQPATDAAPVTQTPGAATGSAAELLVTLEVNGRAPKTDYDRAQFGGGWAESDGCDTRNIILYRDLRNPAVGSGCKVTSGTLNDPYTGKTIEFRRGAGTSADVQIDHVVALSDAWQKGAQQMTYEERVVLANDPLELLAVDGAANQQKSGGDAATWLPSNKPFRCQYVARQIAVKAKYGLWVTQAERDAMNAVLSRCPGQALPPV